MMKSDYMRTGFFFSFLFLASKGLFDVGFSSASIFFSHLFGCCSRGHSSLIFSATLLAFSRLSLILSVSFTPLPFLCFFFIILTPSCFLHRTLLDSSSSFLRSSSVTEVRGWKEWSKTFVVTNIVLSIHLVFLTQSVWLAIYPWSRTSLLSFLFNVSASGTLFKWLDKSFRVLIFRCVCNI